MKIVVVHREMGIYLGTALGLGFWSQLDSAGQPAAVVFESEDQAKDHIRSWDENNDPSVYTFIKVAAVNPYYADIPELKKAGLADRLGNMEADALRYSDVAGSA